MSPLIKHYNPEATLVHRQSENISQQEFMAAVTSLARQLPDCNYIVNLCQDRYNFLLTFAASLARSITNLLPPNRQPQTVAETIKNYPGSVCIIDSHESDYDFETLQINRFANSSTDIELPLIEPEHIAAIAFTSGSTGQPTPNPKPWRALTGTAERLAQRFIKPGSRPAILATVPSQHMYGLEMTVMMALQGNCSIDSGKPFYPRDVADRLEALPQPGLFVTTPIHLRSLTAANIALPGVSRVVSATAPLSIEQAVATEAIFQAPVEEIYGCTEAGSTATRRTKNNEQWLLLDDMKIFEENQRTKVNGLHLDGPVELHDQLEILTPDSFHLIGRSNDVINVAGKRASLAELNRKLLQIEGIQDGAVFIPGHKDNEAKRPAAVVVTSRSEREIRAALSQMIDPVFLPRPLRKVNALERSETGKLQQEYLEELLNNARS